jgi:hypothetical protein
MLCDIIGFLILGEEKLGGTVADPDPILNEHYRS